MPSFQRPATVLALFLLLALALNFPYLFGGFQADDLLFLNMLRADPLPFSRWNGMWSIPLESFAGFTSLWWFEPGVAGSFFRPVPSLVIEASLRLFGEDAFPLHLLSVVLHGVVAFTLFLFFTRVSGRRGVAWLAGVLFLACEDHSMGVGWIATVTDLLAVAFTNLALLAHVSRRDGRERWLLVELACLALALGSKESAVMAPVAIVLLDACLDWPDWRGWLRRARLWLPAASILCAYLAIYAGAGRGGMRTLLYRDPIGQPVEYLRNAVAVFPVMVGAAVSVIPPSLAAFQPETLWPLAAIGAGFGVWLAAGVWPLRRDRVVAWAAAMFVLALLPQVATDASERLLYFPYVPLSMVLATFLAGIGPIARRFAPASPPPPKAVRAWGWYVLCGILLPGLVLSAVEPFTFVRSLQRPERDLLGALPAVRTHLRRHPDGRVILLNTPGPMMTFYAGGVLEYRLRRPVAAHVLSSLNGRMTIERVDERRFVLRTDRPGWVSNMFARVVRGDPLLSAARVYRQPGFEARMIELTADRRDVVAAAFAFDRPLDDPSLLFLSWDGARFVTFDVASLAVGARVFLADTSDVWASM
jgi:hypothetical protein